MKTLVSDGPWEVKELHLTWDKVLQLWEALKKHKTLFSDLTRGDIDNFIRLLVKPGTYWLEIVNGNHLVGLVYLEGFSEVVDVKAHMVFFDRQPAEKDDLCRKTIRYIFDNFAINRITVPTPEMYYAMARQLKRLGFTHEGTLRERVLIGGRWVNMMLFGITRREVLNVIPVRKDGAVRTGSG